MHGNVLNEGINYERKTGQSERRDKKKDKDRNPRTQTHREVERLSRGEKDTKKAGAPVWHSHKMPPPPIYCFFHFLLRKHGNNNQVNILFYRHSDRAGDRKVWEKWKQAREADLLVLCTRC